MESTKTRILKKLLETDGYLSGQDLCEQLGVSRTAVWKYMKQLKEEGYEIEAVQNKGYCLKDVPDVLERARSRAVCIPAGRDRHCIIMMRSILPTPRSSGWRKKTRRTERWQWRIIRAREKGAAGMHGIPHMEARSICRSCFDRISGRIGLRCLRW